MNTLLAMNLLLLLSVLFFSVPSPAAEAQAPSYARVELPEYRFDFGEGTLLREGPTRALYIRLFQFWHTHWQRRGLIKTFSIPVASAYYAQTVHEVSAIHPEAVLSLEDEADQTWYLSHRDTAVPAGLGKNFVTGFIADLTTYEKAWLTVRGETPYALARIPVSIRERYLRSDAVIAWDQPSIKTLVAEIIPAGASFEKRAELVSAWVSRNFSYKFPQRPNTAGQLLQLGYGFCGEFTKLTVALFRAAGVPAREVFAWGRNKSPDNNVHVWTEIYIPGRGWLPVHSQNRFPRNGQYRFEFRHYPVVYRTPLGGAAQEDRFYDMAHTTSGNLNQQVQSSDLEALVRIVVGTAFTVPYSGPEQKELIVRAVRYAALYDCSRDEEAWNLMTALPLEAQVLVAWLLSESPRQTIAAQALSFLIEQRSNYEYDILKTMSYPTLKEKLP